MPSKNIIRNFITDGIYHIYNRGVEERIIFLDEQDYSVFLFYMKIYLSDIEETDIKEILSRFNYSITRGNLNLCKNINLSSYCLMPNHFHLLVQQKDKKSIIEFMQRLSNAYVKYFNKKYKRVGSLFQGRYKAALIDSTNYLLNVIHYIHANPLELPEHSNFEKLENYNYSSLKDYIGKTNTLWLRKDYIPGFYEPLNKDRFKNYKEQLKIFIIQSDKYKEQAKHLLLDY